jgi:CBS domain containing-hemolysin-like protein
VKKSRIEQAAAEGQTVLRLLQNPENFLSKVGITLIGIVAGAYGGAYARGEYP